MNLNTSGVYAIRNTTDGRAYVGSAANIRTRWNTHRCELRLGKHRNSRLSAAWSLFGEAAFAFEILELAAPADLKSREQFWLDHFIAGDAAYNWQPVAYSASGQPISEETKRKLSAIARVRPPVSDQTRAKMSKTRKGRKASPEGVAKRAEAHRGMKRSDETRAKMSAVWERKRQAKVASAAGADLKTLA
jgi:group I intron endonuclease